MEQAALLHNPTAGDEQHDKDHLISAIESEGFRCRYSSTKEKGWRKIKEETDFIIVAGGDGTIRKLIEKLLKKNAIKDRPIALIPCGTANNISSSLGIEGDVSQIVASWKKKNIKKFDLGLVKGLEEPNFFLESVGFGVFPLLMKKMKKVEESEGDTPEIKLNYSLEVLYEIIHSYHASQCRIIADGKDLSGKYIMAEIMNTHSFGPNLSLAPLSDPGDGVFELVLVSEEQQEPLASYVQDKIKGIDSPFIFQTIKAKKIVMSWNGEKIHVDDQLVDMEKNSEMEITMLHHGLEFLVP